MKKLFVGNTDLQLSIEAKKFSPEAVLIQQINLSNLSEIQVGYISLGDHNSADFVKALDTAQELYYIPSDSWDHPDTKLHTEFWLRYYSHRKTVGNFQIQSNTNDLLELVDYRKTSDQQIWVAGDSFTQGVPWVKHNQTYGYLLGERLSLPVSVLAQGGSSISWAADQILRSDIRPNDIVVFMLTAVHRFPYYDTKLKHIYPHSWQLDPSLSNTINENILASDHLLYLAIRSIEQVKQAAAHVL